MIYLDFIHIRLIPCVNEMQRKQRTNESTKNRSVTITNIKNQIKKRWIKTEVL